MKTMVRTSLFVFIGFVVSLTAFNRIRVSCAEDMSDKHVLNQLRSDLDRIFTDRRFAGADWGVQIYSLDRSECLYERNADRLFIPASNTKLITAAVALLRLGPDYRVRTRLFTNGDITNGTLEGDLIVMGYGDPSITVKDPDEDPFSVFRNWAGRLKAFGIQKISGDILGDGSAFERSTHGLGWEWNDLTEGYAAPVSALQFNANRLWIEITSRTKPGVPPSIKLLPLPLYWMVDNKITVGTMSDNPDIEIERSQTGDEITIRGVIPPNRSTISREAAVYDPVHWYLSALKFTFEEEHIGVLTCSIKEIENTDMQSLTLLFTHESPTLSEIIQPMLKESLNLCAETLPRIMGMELNNEGSFTAGREIVEETLGRMAIAKDRYSYADGSGLSRHNLVSAEILVRILRSLYRHPYFSHFYDALAISGQEGTLEDRLKGTKAENNLHAKTGSLSKVSAISGYIHTADDEMLAFSIIANNFLAPKSEADSAQDRVIKKLAEFSRIR